MVKNCCVPQCSVKHSKDSEIKFHLFPKDSLKNKQWIHLLKMGRNPSDKMVVCSRHFKESDYILRGKGLSKEAKRLKFGAVPSLNLPKTKLELTGVLKTKRKRKSPAKRSDLLAVPKKTETNMAEITNNCSSTVSVIQVPKTTGLDLNEQMDLEVLTVNTTNSDSVVANTVLDLIEPMDMEVSKVNTNYSDSVVTNTVLDLIEPIDMDVPNEITFNLDSATSVPVPNFIKKIEQDVLRDIASNADSSVSVHTVPNLDEVPATVNEILIYFYPYNSNDVALGINTKVSRKTQTEKKKSVGVMVKPETQVVSTQTTFEPETQTVSTQTTFKRVAYDLVTDSEIIYLTGLDRQRFEVVCALVEKFNPITAREGFTNKDMILITLYKIRHNLDFKMIGFIFQINRNLLSDVFKEGIDKLYSMLKRINIWEVSYKNKKYYRCIIDCTEFFIARSEDPNIHQLTYSNYKTRPTFKVLVSCDEKGAVNFISDAYPGSISDREIVQRSGLIEKLTTGEAVMADRGFDISDLLEHEGILLNIPPFLSGRAQFTQYEVLKTRIIANRRILIENVNCRAKKNLILVEPMPVSLWPLANKIIYICFSLINFYNPLVKDLKKL